MARRFVGGRRACSVFSAPVRGILDATSQPEASRRHRAIDGRGFGAQAFGLLAKIRAWDTVLQTDAHARAVVYEVHPEVSFAALNGGLGLAAGKKSEAGAAIRTQLLSAVYGTHMEALLAAVPRRLAARDDVLDAVAALWSAERIAAGVACSLPSPPGRDAVGLPMAIWY
jgi:predicted RNase H-like nuclease